MTCGIHNSMLNPIELPQRFSVLTSVHLAYKVHPDPYWLGREHELGIRCLGAIQHAQMVRNL
jgi:hypothetical protein